MKENQGMSQKPIHVQREVGGSRYNLKGMLQNIKDKMMENFDERNSSGAFTSTSDPEVSSDIPSHKVDDNSPNEPQIPEQAVQAGTTAISNNDKHTNPAMPSLDGQSSLQILPQLVKFFHNNETAGKESNQELASEETLSDIVSMPSEGTKELQDLVLDKSGCSGYQNFPPEDNPFSLRTYTETKRDKQTLLSDNAHEMTQLKHHLVDSIKDQEAERIANTISDAYIPSFHQQSSEPSRDTDGVSSDIEGLIECVKALPQPPVGRPQETIIFNKSDHSSNRTESTGIQRLGNVKKFEKKERFMSSMLDQGGPSLVNVPKSEKKEGSTASLNYCSMVEKNGIGGPVKKVPGYLNIKDQETSCSAAPHCNKSNAHREVLPLRDNYNLNKALNATSCWKKSDKNKVIVRFLPKIAECQDVINAFKEFGDISKVEISGTEGASYKAAYVYFGVSSSYLL